VTRGGAIWPFRWGRQQAAAKQGASKLAHSNGEAFASPGKFGDGHQIARLKQPKRLVFLPRNLEPVTEFREQFLP
jgi:hypothetical protein